MLSMFSCLFLTRQCLTLWLYLWTQGSTTLSKITCSWMSFVWKLVTNARTYVQILVSFLAQLSINACSSAVFGLCRLLGLINGGMPNVLLTLRSSTCSVMGDEIVNTVCTVFADDCGPTTTAQPIEIRTFHYSKGDAIFDRRHIAANMKQNGDKTMRQMWLEGST